MQIRNNVRERRRERIAQLIGQQSVERNNVPDTIGEEPRLHLLKDEEPSLPAAETSRVESIAPRTPSPPDNLRYPSQRLEFESNSLRESDPELWWKEREKRLKAGETPGWQGLKGIPPTSSRSNQSTGGFNQHRFVHGLTLRFVLAALMLAGMWGWLKLELPGSAQARLWMVRSVTQDMDFQAIEAWYGDTFGGNPAFFSFNRREPDTRLVSASLSPSETAVPVRGKIVQSYAENGTGIKLSAPGGSGISAIYKGRVQQVTQDPDGGVTIIVQHPNRVLSVYGGLGKSSVKPNDWVEIGQQLGQLDRSKDVLSEGVLYFAVQRNGSTINPAEVVSFD
ncbi:M23 family metallopeptidase [Cohnella terricola]|uniref:M23 family metallopeptidase n=1 Tax=Cohnella terricola TaxID=1289167 RepID=A0A559JVZ0_9BACL|nr:M23 family metallopeptidase [Cohnella terricola]TVY04061.1 M23 family metallopeptidase [Cohnella terricola]